MELDNLVAINEVHKFRMIMMILINFIKFIRKINLSYHESPLIPVDKNTSVREESARNHAPRTTAQMESYRIHRVVDHQTRRHFTVPVVNLTSHHARTRGSPGMHGGTSSANGHLIKRFT